MVVAEGGLNNFLKLALKWLLTICAAVLGGFLFGTVASMAYPGLGVIVGAVLGFTVMGCLTCCITGLCVELMTPVMHPLKTLGHSLKHGTFDLLVTVHRIENLTVLGRVFSKGDLYATIEVGINPKKSTCVKSDGVWEESFRLRISPSDDTILVRVLDQDFFGSNDLGTVAIAIHDIHPFEDHPQPRPYALTLTQGTAAAKSADAKTATSDGLKGKAKIVLSFGPPNGEGYGAMSTHLKENP